MTELQVRIVNELGLHLRAAARFVDAASRFPCRVAVSTDGPAVDGKSLLALSSLLARRGTTLTIRCEGEREAQAAQTLHDLVASGFPGTSPR
ncbi:HPr family phosphocarrier protein [Myxococcota bacterium]|nr:HPr family phosphocarrier protein [Myxococcota bacterium]